LGELLAADGSYIPNGHGSTSSVSISGKLTGSEAVDKQAPEVRVDGILQRPRGRAIGPALFKERRSIVISGDGCPDDVRLSDIDGLMFQICRQKTPNPTELSLGWGPEGAACRNNLIFSKVE
jgi:hypothetical protein